MAATARNEHSVYFGSNTGFVHQVQGNSVASTTQIEGAKILAMDADNESVWVLTHRKEIHELDANTLASKRNITVAYDARSLALVKVAGEVWVGDKTGKIHALALESLEQTAEINASQHPIDCLSNTLGLGKVASGDHQRYVRVWDAASKEELLAHGNHKNFVHAICWANETLLASISDDHNLVVCDVNTKKHFMLPRIHRDRKIKALTVTADLTVYTVGDDCQVREWPMSATFAKIPQ